MSAAPVMRRSYFHHSRPARSISQLSRSIGGSTSSSSCRRCFSDFHTKDMGGLEHTGMTKHLWKIRYREIDQEGWKELKDANPDGLLTKSPADSRLRIIYPFKDDPSLKTSYSVGLNEFDENGH